MSNEVFPSTLSGFTFDSLKKPIFNNLTHSPLTGRDIHIALYNQPVYEFTLINEWLSTADKDSLMGFFMNRRGSFDSFLYTDEDSIVTDYQFATGDGATAAFQLLKSSGGFIETVNNPVGIPSLYINDVLQTSGVTISATGLVTFSSAPANTYSIKWTGSAYYRCVFLEDSLEYNQFMNRLYECNEIKFKGAMVNKL